MCQLKRCPLFRGSFAHTIYVAGTMEIHIERDVLPSACPFYDALVLCRYYLSLNKVDQVTCN